MYKYSITSSNESDNKLIILKEMYFTDEQLLYKLRSGNS